VNLLRSEAQVKRAVADLGRSLDGRYFLGRPKRLYCPTVKSILLSTVSDVQQTVARPFQRSEIAPVPVLPFHSRRCRMPTDIGLRLAIRPGAVASVFLLW
jgi:hypothetical protein